MTHEKRPLNLMTIYHPPHYISFPIYINNIQRRSQNSFSQFKIDFVSDIQSMFTIRQGKIQAHEWQRHFLVSTFASFKFKSNPINKRKRSCAFKWKTDDYLFFNDSMLPTQHFTNAQVNTYATKNDIQQVNSMQKYKIQLEDVCSYSNYQIGC